MKNTFSCKLTSKTSSTRIVIPEDVQRQLNELAPRTAGRMPTPFSAWEDEVIKKYGKGYPKIKLAKILKKAPNAINRRYRELMNIPLGSYKRKRVNTRYQ